MPSQLPVSRARRGVLSLLLSTALVLLGGRAQAAWTPIEDQAEERFNLGFELNATGAGAFQVAFDYRDDANTYQLECSPGRAAFIALTGGKRRLLAVAPVTWKPQNTLTLQRRSWLMRLVLNGQVVLTGYDSAYLDGKIASAGAGWTWKDPKVQPVESIHFDDDFTRAGSQGDSTWKAVAGKWQLTASSDRISSRNAEMSSNPFSYEAVANSGKAFTTAGRWFWDDYDARVALRPSGRSQVGLAVYVQDPKNYLAFLWSPTEGTDARRLVLMRDGNPTVLARGSGAYFPRQWYQLGVRTSPGYIEAIVDGVPVLRARNDDFGQGGIGLLAEGAAVDFDDVTVRSYEFYRQDFQTRSGIWTPDQGGAWSAAGGKWFAKDGVVVGAPQTGDGGKTRLLMAGRPEWDGYQVLVSAKIDPAAAGGLVAGYRDNNNYTVFRWAGPSSPLPFRNRQQVLAYAGGKATVLSDQPLSLPAQVDRTGFVRLNLRWQTGALTISSGGTAVAQTSQPSASSGQLALWSQGAAPASFKDIVILFPPPPEPPKVAPRMEDDAYMVGWASQSGEWPPVAGDNGLEFWNTGDFFGDAGIDFPWRTAWAGYMDWAIKAKRGQFTSGYVLHMETSPEKDAINLTVTRVGKPVASAKVPIASLKTAETDVGVPLHLSLSGGGFTLTGAGQALISYLDPVPLTGTAIAARSFGFRIRADRLQASSSNRDDYTFTDAPIDFYAPQGQWSVFSRWPCYGDWSFFGGYGQAATLWSKRTFGGDIVAEMYAHNQMELPKEVGYSHPGDLNITVCGDGLNPSSGYSFVVGGYNNTRSQILRGNKVIAETDRPEARFEKTINHNMRWHRRWVYIRGEARRAQENGQNGVRLTLTVDDTELLTYFDPQPLPFWEKGGRVAFWTVDGTLMIARAKIECEKPGLKSLPSGLIDPLAVPAPAARGAFSPAPVTVDGLPSAIVTADGANWRVVNPGSGGWFETKWNNQPLEIGPGSKLSFDIQMQPDVHIDAYVKIGEDLYLMELNGNQRPDAMAPTLGKMRLTPKTDGWQTASFDLGAALAKRFPGQKHWTVQSLNLGAVHGDYYRLVGFAGNTYGAAYRVTAMKLEGSPLP